MTTTAPACGIDEEIDKCLPSLSDLRARKNSLLPISRLPPETLANIFTHYARDYHEGSPEFYILPSRIPCWINVSYVCRHWRNIALSCPTLWIYHFTASLRWTEELLTRSKQALLKIHIDSRPRSRLSHIIEKVLGHAERFQELRLAVPGSALPRELSLYAPRLQVLDISVLGTLSRRTLAVKYADIPPLRVLKVVACSLLWHSFNLSGVTSLSLSRIPAPLQQNITEFLATLSRMPVLAILHLDHALASARGVAFSALPKVDLPCLTDLYIAAPLSTVFSLLSCVDVPLTAQFELENFFEDGLSIDDYHISSVLAQRFNQTQDLTSSGPTIRSLVIDSFPCELKFTFSSKHGDCEPQLSLDHPPSECNRDVPLTILVRTGSSTTSRDRERIINDICCSIPSTHVDTLHVVNPPYSDNFWTATLRRFKGVRYMKLSDGDMPDLTPFLTPTHKPSSDITSDHDLTPSLTFLPVLEELELYGITFAFEDEDAGSECSLRDVLSTREALCPVRLTTIECDTKDEEEESDSDHGSPLLPFWP